VRTDLAPIIATNATDLIQLAFLCASSYRYTDHTGGCNGARIRFAPQNTWPGYIGISQVLNLLTPIQSKYPNLSWSDLIVYAGTLALNDPTLTFCPGRTDATDGTGLQFVQGKNFWNATVTQMRNDATLMGFNDTEIAALSALPHSNFLLMMNGFDPTTPTPAPTMVSNQYFNTLKSSTWQAYNTSSGYMQFKSSGTPSVNILMNDYNLINDTSYTQLVGWLSADNNAFLLNFRSAWTKLMNIDRFSGPTGNMCWNTSLPIGPTGTTGPTGPTGPTATATNNGNIWAISLLLFIASLLI